MVLCSRLDNLEDILPMLIESAAGEGLRINRVDAVSYLSGPAFLNGDAECFIAYRHGVPAGCIIGEYHRNTCTPYYEFKNLFVHPEFRGRQVANALMKAAASWAPFGDAPVYITSKGMPREYYKSLGFTVTHTICLSDLETVKARLGV